MRMEPGTYIPIKDLVVGRVYKLNARNLRVGVYDGLEFVGIREKFGSRFLDIERHWDADSSFGTAYPIEDLGSIPVGMSPFPYVGYVCRKTQRPIERESDTGPWIYVDTREPIPAYPESRSSLVANDALFTHLESLSPPATEPEAPASR